MTAAVKIMTERNAHGGGADLLNGAIARRAALLRKGRQQSFDELALRSGVSKGMLVQIEQARANPSIATLCRLAAGLGVSVADLVAGSEESASPVQLVAAGQSRRLWKGPRGGSATLLVGSEGPDMLELWSWALHPGERFEARAHSAGTLELIQVQQGVLALEVGSVVTRVPAGACARAHTDRPHAYACAGRAKVLFAMAVYEPGMARSPRAGRRKPGLS
jgi:transcriptional regulator with XRE-family HTH domain